MARTKKSRGVSAFQMRSGNRPSPNKFLGGLIKGAGAGITNMLGGGAGAQKVGSFLGGGGLFGAVGRGISGNQNFMTAGRSGMGVQALGMRPQGPTVGGGRGGPMAKKEAPYKRIACARRSPMKRNK